MKSIIATAVEAVVFLFAAFGGYLVLMAPPATIASGVPAQFAVGLASFAALLLFLLVKVWIGEGGGRAIWNVAAPLLALAYVVSAFAYKRSFDDNTFVFRHDVTETTVELRGNGLTPTGEAAYEAFRTQEGREPLPYEVVRDEGRGVDGIPVVWTADSLTAAYEELLVLYVVMVVCLAAALASMVELIRSRPASATSGSAEEEIRTPEGAAPVAA